MNIIFEIIAIIFASAGIGLLFKLNPADISQTLMHLFKPKNNLLKKYEKAKGKRKGRGSVKGAKKARTPKKKAWMTTIRALRKDLKQMREDEVIDVTTYRKLYKMAKGGAFRSKSYMRNYVRDHDLIKGDE